MKNWYIIQTFSGFEQKVAETLKEIVKIKELGEKICEVLFLYMKLPKWGEEKESKGRKNIFPVMS